MGLLDLALAPLKAVIGSAERDIEVPVRDIEHIQTRVLGTAEAIRQATESIESHIEVLETLANSIGPLTESVDRLTAQLAEINTVLAPVAATEREISRVEHFFGRRRQPPSPAPPAIPPDAPPPAG